MAVELEDDKLWSNDRALTGFSNTLLGTELFIGGTLALFAPHLAEYLKNLPSPESYSQLMSTATVMKDIVSIGAVFGGAGAVINGFRPTARLSNYLINRHKRITKEFTSDVTNAYRYLKAVDYKGVAAKTVDVARAIPKVGYAVIRPELPEVVFRHKKELTVKAATLSTRAGVAFYGVGIYILEPVRLLNHITNYPDPHTEQVFTTLSTHPLHIVAGTALAGTAATAYALTFGRPSQDSWLA